MSKRIGSFIAAAAVAVFMLMTSFMIVSADSYKNWLQSDSRWRNKTLGGSGDTMAEIGCAVTSVAIQVVHSGSRSESNFNPGTLVDYLNKSGGLDSEGNLYWGAVTGLVSSFTFEKRAYFSSRTKTNIIKELTSYINAGYYIVMSVDYDCHWVAIDTISNGVVYMMDPAQNKTNNLFNYYDVNGMIQVRLFKGKNAPAKIGSSTTTAPPSTTAPVTTTSKPSVTYLTGHYQTTDPLNLRSSNSTSSNVLLTIPAGTNIVVTRVSGGWGETEYNGKNGWVYLEYTKYTESSYTYKSGTYKCTADTGVNMRSGIGTDKSVVCVVPYNATVTIGAVSNNWGKAAYGSYTGYICMDYLKYVEPAATTTTTAKTTAAATTTTTVKTTTTAAATTTTTAKATTTAAATTTTTAKATTTAAATTKATTVTTKYAAQESTAQSSAAVKTTPASSTAAAVSSSTSALSTTVPASQTGPVTTTAPIKGDVNKDGKIDHKDVLALNMFINEPVKIDSMTSYIYDMNNDGIINEIDVIYLMKEIKKLGVKFK